LKGECELIAGQSPLPADPYTSCEAGEESWYERTPYRKIAYSRCEGGPRPDHGAAHACPRRSAEAPSGRGFRWWLLVLAVPFAAAAAAVLAAWLWRGRRAAIRLPTSTDDGALVGMGLDGSGFDP
jgi:ferric-dicitrate binding protein FerR (iron transport regulator)